MICPLCKSDHTQQREDNAQFLHCNHCGTVCKDPSLWPSPEQEKARYLLHENDTDDPGYQQFVAPIVNAVLNDFPNTSIGLDFGAGTGPVISKLLKEEGYSIKLWDPYFHADKSVLDTTYDFIICCEVIEHFHKPQKEFQLMLSLLKPGGKLFCMSNLLPKDEEFSSWYYKNDPTHVVFYSRENLNWIKNEIGFDQLEISDRLIVLGKD